MFLNMFTTDFRINFNTYSRWLFTTLVISICLTVLVDFIVASSNNSGFYISESLLFSSFWLLFFPMIYLFFLASLNCKTIYFFICSPIILVVIHLFTYPAFVFAFSALFFSHTFNYWQTLNFQVSQYGILLIMVYFSLSFIYYSFLKQDKKQEFGDNEALGAKNNLPLTSILVSEANKQSIVNTLSILYFSASSPYISIHTEQKKFLINQTLKSVLDDLDKDFFVRVHKSTIVNIAKVKTIQSRLNGDFDLVLVNNSIVRLSRTYVKEFKLKYNTHHRLTIK